MYLSYLWTINLSKCRHFYETKAIDTHGKLKNDFYLVSMQISREKKHR